MKFFSIPNLAASSVTVLEKPWEKVTDAPPYGDKMAMTAWSSNPGTQHHFLSTCEGLTELVRVTMSDNAPYRLHGFIADYDGRLPSNPADYVKSNPAAEFMPTHCVTTGSGNGRLVWAFERPVMVVNEGHLKAFLVVAAKNMKLAKWLPGFDSGSFGSPQVYYELGKQWTEVAPTAVVPTACLELWLVQAGKDMRFDTQAKFKYNVPIEDVAAEVALRWPGRWKGSFTVGSRGVRFWDPVADNPTGAIVRPDGMQCFTGNQPFVSWRQIFGQAFVDKYEAEYIADIVKDSAYDGRSFWLCNGGVWEEWNNHRFSQELLVRGYSNKRGKKSSGEASEIDIIENTIVKTRKVRRALPFLYYPAGVITYRGAAYLNTSRVKCVQPGPPYTEGVEFIHGREAFPFLYTLIKTMFDFDIVGAEDQLSYFLAWLKYFYENSYKGTPKPGHCIILAGVAGKGKTLLSRGVIGGLMGGYIDAAAYLVQGTEWTGELAEAPLWCVDDQLATSDPRSLLQFSNRVKKLVANAEIRYNEKYQQTGSLPFFGRAVVTCNMDAESLKILPNMDISTLDKICLFRASDSKIEFPSWDEVAKNITRELPAFARFLLDWNMPDKYRANEKRFGVVPYHHPELFEEARQQGIGVVIELLTDFLRQYQQNNPEKKFWAGTSIQLHNDLNAVYPGIMKDLSPRALSTQLGMLARNRFNLVKVKDPTTHVNIWQIAYQLVGEKPEYGEIA